MPRQLQFRAPGYGKLPNNPLNQLAVDPLKFIGDDPFLTMAEEIIFGAADTMIEIVDYVTGLDLLPAALMLQNFFVDEVGGAGFSGFVSYLNSQPTTNPKTGLDTPTTAPVGLFTGLLSWLTSGFGVMNAGETMLSRMITAAGGAGNTLADFGNLFAALGLTAEQIAQDIFGVPSGDLTLLGTNLMSLLGGPNLNVATGFNPVTAVAPFINNVLAPTGLLATLSSGLLSASVIPLLDASKVGTGIFSTSLIPNLPASIINSGIFSTSLIPNLPASIINSGVFTMSLIPNLPASIINSGTFAASLIPLLDASKIGTGVFSTSLIPNLPASIINSGVFSTSLIPNLPASIINSGVFGAGLIPALDTSKITTGTFSTAFVPWAAPIDTLIHAWGGTGSGFLPADLITFASAIPHDNLTGNLGGTNIANTIQLLLDGGVRGVQNNPALVNQTIAQWNNSLAAAMGYLGYNPAGATQPNSVADIASKTDAALKNRAIQNHPYENVDSTVNATFPYNDVATINPLPTIAVTQANPVSSPIRIRDAGQKQSIRWKGFTSATGTLTGFYVNLYHVNETTGVKTWFYSTPNYVASLATGTTPQWNSYNITPATAYINTAQGDLIDVEFTVTGTGTYNMVGKTLSPQTLPMPGIFPSMVAATRVPPASTFDQVGAGASQGNVNSINISWNQPLGASANCIIVGINQSTSAYVAPVVKIGTNTFTQVGTTYNYATNQWLSLWSLFITPGALGTSATVAVTIAGTAVNYVAANSVSRNGVGSIGTPVTFNGTGTAISQTLSSLIAPNEIVQLWGSNSVTAGSAFSNYSKNSRWNQPFLGNVDQATLIGDMTVTSGTSVTVTENIQSSTYGSISVVLTGMLQPAPATIANPGNPGVATSAASPATYARLQPWAGLAGTAGATSYSPVTDPYATPGSGISIQNPAVKYPWANNFDIVMCSDGSGGEGGGYPVGGVGGKAGTWTRQTLTRAQIGTSNLTLNIGAGSAGTGPGVGSSSAASGVSVVVPGFGTISQTGAAGSGSGLSPSAYGVAGDSPGNFSYTDANGVTVPFTGGLGGAGGQAPGGQPGAGGSGGNATYLPNFNGGPGGAAEVWIRSYQ